MKHGKNELQYFWEKAKKRLAENSYFLQNSPYAVLTDYMNALLESAYRASRDMKFHIFVTRTSIVRKLSHQTVFSAFPKMPRTVVNSIV